MERTRYKDGIEVDQSDLINTEDTKSANILISRKDLQHFGVVEGLEVSSPDGSTLSINPGRAYSKNGELVEVKGAITNITGAPTQTNVFAIVGLRITEVTTTPKAHESDPITEDTRFVPQPIAELFVATDATEAAKANAEAQALSAALNDENFVPLATMTGLGTTVGNISSAVLARTKGGLFPAIDTARPDQITALQAIYNNSLNDQKPIQSAEDHFHRGLLGSGNPNAKNPHGVALDDVGFDTGDIIRAARVGISNGIIGMEPANDDWAPDTGSFAFSTSDAQTQVTVNGLASEETCIINNSVFTEADFPTSTNISFAGESAGFYYIAIQYGTGFALAIKKIAKDLLDGYCPSNNGIPVWLNNALEPVSGERQYLVIGCVNWDGVKFINLNSVSQLQFPPNGDLTYNVSWGEPFLLRAEKRLDLRRFGVITNEGTQKRTIRLDRLTEIVITPGVFGIYHDSYAVSTGLVVRGYGSSPKHLSDNQARLVFGHAYVGGDEHSLATTSNAGFMSAGDKSKLDSLGGDIWGISLLRWGEVNTLQKKGEKAMGDSAAASDAGPDSDEKSYKYIFDRPGRLQNFQAFLGRGTRAGHRLWIYFYVWQWGQAIPAANLTLEFPGPATQNPTDLHVYNITNTITVPSAGTIMVTRKYEHPGDTYTRPQNLSITCEYAFTL